MLDPRWRKALRDLVGQHRARSVLVVLALALGLAAAGAILDTWALVQRTTHEGYLASQPASATLSFERVEQLDPALMQRLRARPDVAAWRARRVLSASVQGQGPWRNALLIAPESFDGSGLGRLAPHAGAWPPRDGEVSIEKSSLEFAAAAVGEPLQLKLANRDAQSLPLVGVLRDVSQAPGWMEHVVYLYLTPATLQQLGAPSGVNELQFRAADASASRADLRRIAAAVQAELESAGLRVLAVDVPEPGEHIHAAQMDSLMLTQGAFGLLALGVCGLLIANLFGALLAGQMRQIGVMKVLGAQPRQLVSMYLLTAALIGVASSLVALPLAAFAGRRYATFKAELLNFPLDGITLPAWAWLLQLAVGLLQPLLAAALPVLRACRMPVGPLLRDVGIVAPGQALALRRVLPPAWLQALPRTLLLALGNAFRRRRRMLLTLLALAAGGAVQLGAENLRGAVRESVNALFAAQRYTITLRLAPAQPAARVEALAREQPGVARAEAWRGKRTTLRSGDALGEGLTLIGLPPTTAQLQPTLLAGRWLREDDTDAVVIGNRLLRERPDLWPGATLELQVDRKPRTMSIVGVADAGPQPIAYVSRSTLDAWAGDTLAGTLTIAADSTSLAGQLELVRQLRAAFDEAGMPVAGSQLQAENRRVTEDHLVMVVDFLGVMGLVMLAVGGIGLASTMSIAVLERQRELAVMRALGAPRRTLLALVQTEGLVIAALAWLAALPLSVPVAVVLAAAFGRIMFAVPTPWWPDPAAAARWGVAMLVISLVACAWPAWRAARQSPARALGYE